MSTLYISRLLKIAEATATANADAFEKASTAVAETLANKGLVHLYGSGQSVLPVQETYRRYGAYVGFNPLTDPRVMWHNILGAGGVRELLWLERTEKYAEKFLDHQPLNAGDTIVIDTGAPVEDAIVPSMGWSRPVAGSSTVLAMMMMHELLAESAQKLADRGIELPVFASPTIPGVTLHDTDIIYGVYRERMLEAQQKHLPQFKKSMAAEG